MYESVDEELQKHTKALKEQIYDDFKDSCVRLTAQLSYQFHSLIIVII